MKPLITTVILMRPNWPNFFMNVSKIRLKKIIPGEVDYLYKYDEMKRYLDDRFEMPDKTVAILIRFLEQNEGKFSKRAKTGEFKALTDEEIAEIEKIYSSICVGISSLNRASTISRFRRGETLSDGRASHASILNISNIARECQVERKEVENYISIVDFVLYGKPGIFAAEVMNTNRMQYAYSLTCPCVNSAKKNRENPDLH